MKNRFYLQNRRRKKNQSITLPDKKKTVYIIIHSKWINYAIYFKTTKNHKIVVCPHLYSSKNKQKFSY